MDINWTEVWQALGQVLSGLVIGLGFFFWQKVNQWHKTKNHVGNAVNQNLRIKDVMIEIRAYYSADRVKLFQFHNGDHYISGTSMQKCSLTHYVLGRGVGAPIGVDTELQNIPVSYLDHCLVEILRYPYSIGLTKDFPDDSYLAGLFRRNGTEQILTRAIYNRRQEIIGFIIVTWLEPVTLSEEQKGMSKDFAATLSDEMLSPR